MRGGKGCQRYQHKWSGVFRYLGCIGGQVPCVHRWLGTLCAKVVRYRGCIGGQVRCVRRWSGTLGA